MAGAMRLNEVLAQVDAATAKKIKAADPGIRKAAQGIDQTQARRLASRLMAELCRDNDDKVTQRKALDLCSKWLKVR